MDTDWLVSRRRVFISFEQFVSCDRIVAVLGEYCEGPNFHKRNAAEQRELAVRYMQDRSLLMVWDNFESVLPQFNAPNEDGSDAETRLYTPEERGRITELFSELTVGSGRGRVLVTCRPSETGLQGAQMFELQGVARSDSLWLLHQILQRYGGTLADARLSRDKVETLVNEVADHPLSLELIGPHLRQLSPEAISADLARIVQEVKQTSNEDRNTSLLASLKFSTGRLNPSSRSALGWLGLFKFGAFESILLHISQIAPSTWQAIRSDLEGTALARPEDDAKVSDRPFLRFHPTLALICKDEAIARDPDVQGRYIATYAGLARTLQNALDGGEPRTAIAILDRDESNYRKAIQLALARGDQNNAALFGGVFAAYLQRSGRLRDYVVWLRSLRDSVSESGFTEFTATVEREYASALASEGEPQEAVNLLESLNDALQRTTNFDSLIQLALTTETLGRVLVVWGQTARSVQVLRAAIGRWEEVVNRKEGRSWNAVLKTAERKRVSRELGGLATSQGSLANALRHNGEFAEALDVAQKCLSIHQAFGNQADVARDLGRMRTDPNRSRLFRRRRGRLRGGVARFAHGRRQGS